MRRCLLIFLLATSIDATADSFRCGTRLVLTGDPVTRLTRACGQPERTYKGRAHIGNRGNTRPTSVTQWVYRRSGKREMIVSVKDGIVVKISRG